MDEKEISAALEEFFRQLDAAFPDGEIIWDDWNHEAWDKTAVELCNALGYTSGAPFLTAYGYGIFADGKHIPPTGQHPVKGSEPVKQELPEFFTGTVQNVLPYNNSGFVRKDGGGDYYFNVRDFTHRVELKAGLRVQFKLKERMDHKRNKKRLNAVELTEIE